MNKISEKLFILIDKLLKYRIVRIYGSICFVVGLYVSSIFLYKIGQHISTLDLKFDIAQNNLTASSEKIKIYDLPIKEPKAVEVNNLSNTYDLVDEKSKVDERTRRQKQLDYVKKYAHLAKRGARYGILPSIKMAQAIHESNCGQSKLAKRNKNHFGIKCGLRKCRKDHCSNFTDDSHKDFFRQYQSIEDSFEDHNKFLQKARYKHLFGETDYKKYAEGLQRAGYATDKKYAHKIISLIDALNLDKLDK